jgi:protein subunit release factor B
MRQLGVHESDFEESFLRSSGKGGQNVNKVATCVYLCHGPTRLNVKCQEERQQGLNRYRARCLLLDKIEEFQASRKRAAIAQKEKQRRQKRGRSPGGKEETLERKRHRKERKQIRRKISTQKMGDYL